MLTSGGQRQLLLYVILHISAGFLSHVDKKIMGLCFQNGTRTWRISYIAYLLWPSPIFIPDIFLFDIRLSPKI